jgi:Arc/MetJ-type ribon-helix-helix transcriptional regulator
MLGTKCNTKAESKGRVLPPVRIGGKLWDDLQEHLQRTPDASMSEFRRRALRETIARDRRHQNDRAVRQAGDAMLAELKKGAG